MNTGVTVITATSGGVNTLYNITVEDYANVYCDKVMDDYIAANITDDMSDLELVKAITRFPASYDYSPYYSSANSMIINGGGDCWASTGAIIAMCDKLGIKAWSRNGNKDSYAGSGHMNAMVELNGVYYEAEAGYSSPKGSDGYRPYGVKIRTSLFSYHLNSGNASIYQYDGYDKTGTLEIPATINGYPVTAIEASSLTTGSWTKVELPDTLTTIGDYAFSSCKSLESVHIPASVSSIGLAPFVQNTCLTDLTIDPDNPNYVVMDGTIYTKDLKTLVFSPNAATVNIPDTVTTIKDYAFYYNNKLVSITIPASVTKLGEGVFGNCTSLTNVIFEDDTLTEIGMHCFRNDSNLTAIRLPSTLEKIGCYAFNSCSKLQDVYFTGDAPTFGTVQNGVLYDSIFTYSKAIIHYPAGNETWTEEILAGHGSNSFESWVVETSIDISTATLELEQDEFDFVNKAIVPNEIVTLDDKVLTKDEDYRVTLVNNVNAGTATISCVGIGKYTGSIAGHFAIHKVTRSVYLYPRKTTLSVGETTDFSSISPSGTYQYESSAPEILTVDESGVITAKAAGQAVVKVTVRGTGNYLDSFAERTFTVKEATATSTEATTKATTKATTSTDSTTRATSTNSAVTTTRATSTNSAVTTTRAASTNSAATTTRATSTNSVATTTRDISADSTTRVTTRDDAITTSENIATTTQESGFDDGNQAGGNQNQINDDDEDSFSDDDSFTGSEIRLDSQSGLKYRRNGDGAHTVTVVGVEKSIIESKIKVPKTVGVGSENYKVTAVGAKAFKGCNKVTKIVLGANVKKIGREAFAGCKRLKTIAIRSKKMTNQTIAAKAFKGVSKNAKIYVPKSKLKTYKKLFRKKGLHKKAKFKKQ